MTSLSRPAHAAHRSGNTVRLVRTTLLALGCGVAGLLMATQPARAQAPVLAVEDAERLFTSPDPQLHANKQVVYRIIRELLEAGQWQRADELLTERYIQHNPNAASGRAGVVHYFVNVLKVPPRPLPARIATPIAAVMAEGDLVTVLYPREVRDAKNPSRSYSTTWFDTWRIRDGKADEHWDPALRDEGPDLKKP